MRVGSHRTVTGIVTIIALAVNGARWGLKLLGGHFIMFKIM